MNFPFKKSHLVLIAVDKYDDPGIDDLLSPVADAKEITNLLTLPPHNYDLMQPENTTHDGIMAILEQLPSIINTTDRLLLYFAGHGTTLEDENGRSEGYIIPKDGKLGEYGKNWISMKTLVDKIDKLQCKHVLIILDCCFAGTIQWANYSYRNIRVEPRRVFKEHFDFYVEKNAWQAIVSAAFDQTAKDVGWRNVRDKKLSPFVEALSRGLKGEADFSTGNNPPDGIITATELAFFLRVEVEQKALAYGITHRQTPRLISLGKHDRGEYIFLNPRQRLLELPSAVEATKKNNPFNGLQTYSEEDHRKFYGRDRVIDAITSRLTLTDIGEKSFKSRLIIVTGISGSGKSSVIKAGVIPVLKKKGWQHLGTIRPGESPLESFKLLESAAGTKESVVVVDQMEELITQNKNKGDGEKFMALLYELMTVNPQAHIIITIRSDFENLVPKGTFNEVWNSCVYRIPWFNRDELRDIIIRPAMNIAFFYEPVTLVDRIIDDVLQYPGSLPMLSTLLSELYVHAVRNISGGAAQRLLEEKEYDNIRGVTGALQSQLNDLSQSGQTTIDAIRCILLRMLNLEGGILSRKKANLDELTYDDPVRNAGVNKTIELLEKERIISSVEGHQNTWEPVHDAVVRWKDLDKWIEIIGTERLLIQKELETDVALYIRNGGRKADLWHGNERLDRIYLEFEDETVGHSIRNFPPNSIEKQFITASYELKMKNKRRRKLEITIFISALLGGLIIVIILLIQSTKSERTAKAEKLRADKTADTARLNEQRAVDALRDFRKELFNRLIQNGDVYREAKYFQNALIEYDSANNIRNLYPLQDSVFHNMTTTRSLQQKINECKQQLGIK